MGPSGVLRPLNLVQQWVTGRPAVPQRAGQFEDLEGRGYPLTGRLTESFVQVGPLPQ